MSGGHKLRLLFRSDQQASKAEHVPTVYVVRTSGQN